MWNIIQYLIERQLDLLLIHSFIYRNTRSSKGGVGIGYIKIDKNEGVRKFLLEKGG